MTSNKILFVLQKRNDAIGIVDNSVINELLKVNHNFEFFYLKEKGYKKYEIIGNYIFNIVSLLLKSIIYNKIYFSWENPYVIFVKFFFPWKKIYMCVMHVEDYWGKTLIGKLIFKSVSKFIVISEFTKNQLLEYGIKSDNIFVNYLGISSNYYPENISNFTDFDFILYVGTELERKNIKNLLLAFNEVIKKYPKLKLIKIGKPVIGKETTDNLVNELGLKDNIIFKREFISEFELRKYYSNSICYISVATLEGFGMTVPEAMSCGCPVVVSDIGPFNEIVLKSQVIVNPYDIKSIKEGILKYINDKDFRNKMIDEGLINSKRFNWKTNANKIINILNNY
ncbi:MAG: glycosyltransferase family 1 protein [Candidatus Gracilibacteria bacterium]|nr:glycosyltransferase family 1 protein [Candidatus Gracilibacteria bacterium]